MPDIAKAYVQIIPSAQGVKKNLENVMSEAGNGGGESFNASFGSVLKKIATSAVIIKAAQAIVGVFTNAIQSASQYEQLEGGVVTLFASSSDKIIEYANNAYATAGISANKYMETVTSFAASLVQSTSQVVDEGVKEQLDKANAELELLNASPKSKGKAEKIKALKEEIESLESALYVTVKSEESFEAASEAANQAVIDMADNANKMGTPMESIMNAYQGFAKQNYTMLDNLKLGYGGTKSEMERLLADAQSITGIEYDIGKLDDVYAAIHVIQQDLGITGTTALEAADTMAGSAGSMAAAWENVVTAMAGGGDLTAAIQAFSNSASGMVKNLTPMITAVFSGIVQVATTLLPQLGVLVPGFVDVLLQNLPLLIDGAVQLFLAIVDAIPIIIPQIIDALPGIIVAIVNGLGTAAPAILAAAVNLMMNVFHGLYQLVLEIPIFVGDFVAALIAGFAEYGKQVIETGKNFILGFEEGMSQVIDHVIERAKEFCSNLVKAVKEFLGIASPSKVAKGIGVFFGEGFAIGMDSTEAMVANSATRLAAAATGSIGDPWSASGIAGHQMTQINITAKELSQQDIDYVVGYANSRLGVMA